MEDWAAGARGPLPLASRGGREGARPPLLCFPNPSPPSFSSETLPIPNPPNPPKPPRYDPEFVCNGSDDTGRYDYRSQPEMVRWGCERLAESLKPALPLAKSRAELRDFDLEYDRVRGFEGGFERRV